ncbi:MAG: putative lipid II flippase FtsW [Bdellovibrionales bacterium]|nr:putative lipid II flippase FtsW [Bdellovibrionales bacterium]
MTKQQKIQSIDVPMALSFFFLLMIGLIMVYSASSLTSIEMYQDGTFFLKKHLAMLAIGIFVMTISFFSPLSLIRKLTLPLFLIAFILLVLLLVSKMGVEAKHATRWIEIFGFRFQPSELAKPALILFVAGYIDRVGKRLQSFQDGLLPLLIIVGLMLLLIMKQPDFGTTVTIAATLGMMLFIGEMKWSHFFSLLLGFLFLGAGLVYSAQYRVNRVLAFLNPWNDPQGKGFQILQSYIAFGRGGLQGEGLGDGTQKLLYLPEAHTDFIFSVIAEELGLIGSLSVVFLFFVLVLQGFRLVHRISDPYASQLALGITCLFGLQACLNMGVVMGLLPTKGLTLPFVSYGGSSLIVSCFLMGILLSLSSLGKETPLGRSLR